jgi:hypothetical protein
MRAMCLTLRLNNLLETGMRQYENQSVAAYGSMASIEADVKGGGIIIISFRQAECRSTRCNIDDENAQC